jgi:4-amino-4-deoxy-L-arabinose transferase-like glycosyltransferase
MWSLAHDTFAAWLAPHNVGIPSPEEGPLAFWLGAIAIKLFGGWIGDVAAARVVTVCVFLVGATSIWYATFLLGRRNEAQPLKLAFGGQPDAADYGRTLADAALLIYLGCWGLLLNSHQTTAEALQVALIAFGLYRLVRYLDKPGLSQALLFGSALTLLALTRGYAVALMLWLAALACLLLPGVAKKRGALHMAASLVLAVMLLLLWRSQAQVASFDGWLAWNHSQIGPPNWAAFRLILRYGMWFFWPAWPFAAWALYAWRRQRYALHIALPALFALTLGGLCLLSTSPAENQLLPLLPPLVILAAFGLPTMKRGAINAVDWFAVMAVTVSAALIWLHWIAMLTGWPPQLAKNTLKLVPGFKPELNLAVMLIALVASMGWIALVYWRISRQPSVLWRAVVLSSGGLILCWLLLMTLFMPWSNYRLSYAPVAKQIAQHLPANTRCIQSNISPAQRASFAYFGSLPIATPEQANCPVLLLQYHMKSKDDDLLTRQFKRENWVLLWQGKRAADHDERFRLYQRKRQPE